MKDLIFTFRILLACGIVFVSLSLGVGDYAEQGEVRGFGFALFNFNYLIIGGLIAYLVSFSKFSSKHIWDRNKKDK